MRRYLRGIIVLTIGGGIALPVLSQQSAPPKAAQPAGQFFSGAVTAVSADSITVVRRGLGKDSVTRKFAIDSTTKIEGRPRIKAKVTVRFVSGEDGDRAVHIIVR